MNDRELLALLEGCGAIRPGHFRLTSGRHADVYVEKARVLEHADLTMRLAGEIVSWYDGVDVVAAPAVGAVPLGFAVALSAGARSVFAEREDGAMRLRRGFVIRPGERALIVEDVVTTGGSAAEVHALATRARARALGVAALVDRSAGPLAFPLRALARIDAPSWEPGSCPLCRRGVPLESPGSRHVRAS